MARFVYLSVKYEWFTKGQVIRRKKVSYHKPVPKKMSIFTHPTKKNMILMLIDCCTHTHYATQVMLRRHMIAISLKFPPYTVQRRRRGKRERERDRERGGERERDRQKDRERDIPGLEASAVTPREWPSNFCGASVNTSGDVLFSLDFSLRILFDLLDLESAFLSKSGSESDSGSSGGHFHPYINLSRDAAWT